MTQINDDFLDNLTSIAGKQVLLYGAGEGGKIAKDAILNCKLDIEIIGFIDDSKNGYFEGLPIYKLDNIQQDNIILITSAYWHIISKKLDCIKNNWYILSPNLFYDYLIFDDNEYQDAIKKTEQIKSMFINNDYDLYLNILKAHYDIGGANQLLHIYNNIFAKSIEYLDHINIAEIKVIIEGGVLDGKNSKDFVENIGHDIFIYGFGPIWNLTSKNHHIEEGQNLKIIKKALSSKEEDIYFNFVADSNESSKIVSNNTGLKVSTISIDKFIEDEKIENVDFIKLDIEGAEMQTLIGAQKTIEQFRPQMATSIYHSKTDLVEIPLYLASICSEYSFAIGHYSKTYWDTILYAIPNEKLVLKG